MTRAPDEDLIDYLENNEERFALEHIVAVHAEVPGHNDEWDWYWVLELITGQFTLTKAWCDYSGWDCQSGGESVFENTAEDAAMRAPEEEYGRRIQENLLKQLRGEQPIGLEVYNTQE